MIQDIKLRFERLIALYEAQKERSENLSSELVRCRESNEALVKQNADLKNQIDKLKLSAAFRANDGSASEAKERIERLVGEIDKCISLLES
ncbi:MAG: hypothetical protein MJY45_04050 [Bacteroidales bacterium]|nr:hypothetical protein [Bacteroidales bacterium]